MQMSQIFSYPSQRRPPDQGGLRHSTLLHIEVDELALMVREGVIPQLATSATVG